MSELIVPGKWHCDNCGFTLIKNTLFMGSGTVGADYSIELERCPNDATPMRAFTWKEEAQASAESVERLFAVAQEYEALLMEFVGVLTDHRVEIGTRAGKVLAGCNRRLDKGLMGNL